MHLAEQLVDGGFRVYAAALQEAEDTGFQAAVVVKQVVEAPAQSREVFRSERLDTGASLDADSALAIALCAGVVVAHQLREAQCSAGRQDPR